MRQTSLCSACCMHSSMHMRHMAMQASSIDIITGAVMPCIRIIERIMVPHMSAQFMHATLQSIICVEQTVQACSHAAHAAPGTPVALHERYDVLAVGGTRFNVLRG